MSEQKGLAAGNFSSWLGGMRIALKDDAETEVPCGECIACCVSSYFVHIQPGETETLSHIPDALLFPAPGMPEGNVLMGYDEKGHCPMLKEGACSIYEHRPQTCKSYDCRIFPATGIQISSKDKALITQQVERWKFNISGHAEINEYKALQKAGSFLSTRSRLFQPEDLPGNPTQLAIMAIKVYNVFLEGNDNPAEETETVEAIRRAREKFDTKQIGT
jgi:Fe-S-cluster containining protein